MRAKFWVVGLALLAMEPGADLGAQETPARSPRTASYVLAARLDPDARQITGRGTVLWRNDTPLPATELRFHMYWNAWRDTSSTWMREQLTGRWPELRQRPAESRGSIDLTALAVRGAEGVENALTRARYIAPDDGNQDDKTVLELPLAQAVAPGATVEVEFEWRSRVPVPFLRTGAQGNYFLLAHWFPKVGARDASGWNTHQFHASTEFFANFGNYDVSLTVPAGWTVGATGRQLSRTAEADGYDTHRYVQEDVHDFAWTTSPDFLEFTERFEEPGLPPVELRLLLQPEHRGQQARHFAAARNGLRYFGQWLGPYPYRQLTIVDPVTVMHRTSQGFSTAGMEYPTFIVAGTNWLSPWAAVDLEEVTIHEVGHQFLHTVVATNEFEHAWMDEGLTTYLTGRVLDTAHPWRFVRVQRYFGGLVVWPYRDVRWQREFDGNRIANYRTAPDRDVQSAPTWRYWPATASSLSYGKTAVWLATLERLVGWETMQKVMATYYARGSFRHPRPEELFAIASEVSGRDLKWFFDATHGSSATFDYAIAQVDHHTRADGQVEALVSVRRIEEGVFPVDVRVDFADGTHAIETWDGRDRWRTFTFARNSRVVRATVDPDRILQLDLNETNNSWTAAPQAKDAAAKWALHWLLWLQHTLLTYAFFV